MIVVMRSQSLYHNNSQKSPLHDQFILRWQCDSGLLKSHAAHVASSTMADGCSRLVRIMLGYIAPTSKWYIIGFSDLIGWSRSDDNLATISLHTLTFIITQLLLLLLMMMSYYLIIVGHLIQWNFLFYFNSMFDSPSNLVHQVCECFSVLLIVQWYLSWSDDTSHTHQFKPARQITTKHSCFYGFNMSSHIRLLI